MCTNDSYPINELDEWEKKFNHWLALFDLSDTEIWIYYIYFLIINIINNFIKYINYILIFLERIIKY